MPEEPLLLVVALVDLRSSPSRGELRVDELLVDAVVGSTAAELAAALFPAVGLAECGPGDLRVDGRPLDGSQLVGMPPLLDGVMLTVGGPGGELQKPPGLLEAHVVSGPDAGQVFRLGPGEHRVGRSPECQVRLDDPEISRVHCALVVGSDTVGIIDLASTNGVTVDHVPMAGRATMTDASLLQVGRSTIRLRIPAGSPAAVRADGRGHLLVNRRPRVRAHSSPRQVTLPAPPHVPPPSRLPVLALLVPLALSLTLAAAMRAPTMLVFALMSPVLMLTTWFGDRRGSSRRRRREMTDYHQAVARARADLDAARQSEQEENRQRHPDLATVLTVAEGRLSRLWERRPEDEDHLVIRLGTGRMRAESLLVAQPGADADVDTEGVAHRLADESVELDDLPATLDLREVAVVGVAGPRRRRLALATSLVAQLACWHSPLDLRIAILTMGRGRDADWRWATLLPHARSEDAPCSGLTVVGETGTPVSRQVAALTELVRQRVAEGTHHSVRRPRMVLILDGGARLRGVDHVAEILDLGPAVGVHVIALDSCPERLPVEVRCLVTLDESGPARVRMPGATADQPVTIDEPQARWGVRLARSLAPLRDATPRSGSRIVPRSVRLLDLVDPVALRPDRLAARWAKSPRSTQILIGVGIHGPLALDLRRDGPHVLVAGTTGAGKSELLQTLIASLALGNRPDELGFILVDYKGGSAFRMCADLPHTLGVVTDLDGHLTERALASLSAELRRRERLFAAAGSTDLAEYQASSPTVHVPRLVIVIDEFRLLAEELPDFVQGLVRIAAVGRSLGVHLVLATQRPGGIVSADIRANVSLRIALRVRDRVDSTDVVEAPEAADIRQDTPGRAFVRSGARELTEFQTAQVTQAATERARIVVRSWPWPPEGSPMHPAWGSSVPAPVSDLARIVAATRQATVLHAIPPLPPPWLPPLPEQLPLDLLPLDTLGTDSHVPFGLRDEPTEQRQELHTWDLLGGGNIGFAGGGRSGRTTALRTIAGAIASRWPPDRVHLYAVHAGDLAVLTQLPHTAALAHRDDVEHVDLVLRTLFDVVRQRQERLNALGHTSIADPVDTGTGGADLPWLVLLIDGWEALCESMSAVDYGRPTQDLLRLIRDGAGAGLRVAVTGERALLAGPLCALVSTRLMLRVADPVQLALAGIPATAVPAAQPPGRAVSVSDHLETQVAFLGRDASPHAQVAALTEVGRTASERATQVDPDKRPRLVRPLPRQVALSDLGRARDGRQDRHRLLLGVGEGDLAPVGFDLGEQQRRIAVVGPPRSGRTTALLTLVRSLLGTRRPVVVVTPRSWPSSAQAPTHVLGPHSREELVGLRRRHHDLAVVVDDAEQLSGAPVEPVLREICRLADEDDGVIATASTPFTVAGETLVATVERQRCGVLLWPEPSNGDVLGVRVTRAGAHHPGRGLLVVDGRTRPIQVAR